MNELRKMSGLSGIRERRDLKKKNTLIFKHLVLYMTQCIFNTKFTIPVTFVDIAVMKETGIFTSGSLKDDGASMVKLLVKLFV